MPTSPDIEPHPSPQLHAGARSLTARLADVCARRAWTVVAVWAVVAVAAGYLALGIGEVVSADEMTFTGDPESARADEALAEAFGAGEGGSETVVVSSASREVEDPEYQDLLGELTADLLAAEAIESVYSYPAVAAFDPEAAAGMVSDEGRSTILPITASPDAGGDFADEVERVLGSHQREGFLIATVGGASVAETFMSTAEEDLLHAELFGLPVTLAVLVLVFGTVAAAGVSMLLAAVSIVTAIGLAAVVGRALDLSFFVVNMISMIGLAVGIDYALFIIARYREERRAGADRHSAVVIAGGTASRAVLFSGITVILALLGLFLVPITTFRSLGLGATIVVAVAVVAMLTLVPAVLGLVGDGIDRLRPPGLPGRRAAGAGGGNAIHLDHVGSEGPYAGWWGRVARAVMVRPVISVALSAGVLFALAVPFAGLERGSAGAETLPPGDQRRAYEVLEGEFSAGLLSPVEVAVVPEAGSSRAAVEPAVEALQEALAADPAFLPQPQVTRSESGVVRVTAPLALAANSDAAYQAVERLRAEVLPALFAGVPAQAFVGGETARNADSFAVIDEYTPWVFAFVLGLSFVLLLVAFRSIVVPLKAILMNLLSVGAAYGVLVLVFQEGWLIDVLGFQRTPAIEAWVPIFLFCILFGLSMDYHVFLLSRIREHFDLTGRNAESVAVGLASTGRIITGAAAIMVVVFGTFAAGRLVMMQQVGFGLAVAVFLDATIVRSVLVPATMALLGSRNWYFPGWLRWLPDLRIEGGPGSAEGTTPVPGAE